MRSKNAILALVLLCFVGGTGTAQETGQRAVAFTFDDLPLGGDFRDLGIVEQTNRRLLATLRAHNVPAIGFVNESKLCVEGEVDARIGILRTWLDAGLMLGNHTYSHISLHDNPLWKVEDEVIRGEAMTRHLLEERGLEPRYFRHPYTRTGPTKEIKEQFEEFLRVRGYQVAPFTIENADYIFDAIYTDALEKGENALAARTRGAYLDHTEAVFEFFERLSHQLLGYEVRQILLVHVNRLNADVMEEMIRRLKARGYDFVRLDQALEDKAYQLKDGHIGRQGLSWLHRWALGMGKPNRMREEPDPPAFVLDRYRTR